MTQRANNNNKKKKGMKIMDLINEIRHPTVSSKKVEQTLCYFCQVFQARLAGGEPKLGSNDDSACLPLTMDAILNYVMQRRHYDIIVYEWSLSALSLFSSFGSSNQATFLVSMGAIQRTLQVLEYFPSAERLNCAGMAALSHMVANATSSSLRQAIIYGNANHSPRTTPLFLFENLVRTMQTFPNSAPICEHACATFGAAYVQNGHQLSSRGMLQGEGCCVSIADQEVILLFRALECVYHGLTMHSDDYAAAGAGGDDKEGTRVLRSFLRLFAGPDLTHKILHQVECQLCHGGVA
jgi:hypothetical protein